MKQTFQIATPSLAHFTEEIVRMCKDGWELDNENVAHTAHNYGNLYAVILVKQEGVDTYVSDASSEAVETKGMNTEQVKRAQPRRKAVEGKVDD